jgi:hypothetical protein
MFSFIKVLVDIYEELLDIDNNDIGIIEYYVNQEDNFIFATIQYDFFIRMLNCLNQDSKTNYEKFILDSRGYEISFWNFPERDDYIFNYFYNITDKDDNILYFNEYIYLFNMVPQKNNEVLLFFGKLEQDILSQLLRV